LFALVMLMALVSEGDAQDFSVPTLEPVSGLFFLEWADLNASLRQAGFAELSTPMHFAGSWSTTKLGDWPFGASILQGAVASGEGIPSAQLGLQLVSLFVMPHVALSETFPKLEAFLGAGLAIGQAQLTLAQRPLDEKSFGDILKTAHDTNLQRIFLAALPRVGIEFKLGEILSLRASLGYLFGVWSSPWGHGLQSISGPPKNWQGLLLEFSFAYKATTK
jgi:hypothetical protein